MPPQQCGKQTHVQGTSQFIDGFCTTLREALQRIFYQIWHILAEKNIGMNAKLSLDGRFKAI